MSINITSTSDPLATDAPTSSSTTAVTQEDTQKYPGVSALMSAVPDPAVIAKLANEFFAALPAATLPSQGAIPAAPQAVPDFPREVFSSPAVPNPPAVAGVPLPPSQSPTAPLSEADFRAIAASLSGATAFASPSTAAAPPALPGSSSSSVEAQEGGPWTTSPQIPPAAEMYSFPGVPTVPSSPPTAPPSGADLASAPSSASGAPHVPSSAGRTNPWAEDPHFAGLTDVFSFPRVPGASVPGVPETATAQPSVPASEPVLGTIPAAPAIPTAAPESAPTVPKSIPSFAKPETNADVPGAEKVPTYSAPTNFPSVSELFSFPGVPGAQSPPGVPVLPSSIPTESPAAPDLSGLAGASASPPNLPGAPPPSASAAQPAPAAGSLPQGVESFEFRPDLEPADLGVAKRPLDPRLIRQDFPILQERVHGRQLIWLDNAATTQKPNAVIDRLSYFYRHENSNIHRAAHTLAARATDAYESAREKTRRFMNASSTREIIFVRGTTEGINLVAKSWGHRHVQKDDEIVITWLEHHANIVPWQQLCSEKGARLRVAPVNDRGEIILEEYEKLLSSRTKIVSFSQVSNALGTITPAREMVEMAHRHGARVLVDGAQSVSHMRTDVQALDCDFYVFSGHKVFGPTGIGVVYGKSEVLENTPPWQGGGNMIVDVTFEKTVYQSAPARFEAGTGNIADAVGLGAALDYVEQVGMESIAAYEHELLNYATAGLLTVPGLRLIGTAREKAGVLSFVLDDIRTEDVGAALNQEGIAVRSGHHCAQPILRRMGVESTVRPSLALYNTCEEIDALVAALQRIQAGRGHRAL
ncbi:MAG: family 2A encapsulin nanocompartment cargo protein cysteine desulfurase [Terriglobales bacterium]